MNELATPGAGDLAAAPAGPCTIPTLIPADADVRPAALVYALTTVYNTTINNAPAAAPPPPPAAFRVMPQSAAPAAPVVPGVRRYSLAEVVVWAGACLLGGGAVDAALTGFLYAVHSHAFYLLGIVPSIGAALTLAGAAAHSRAEVTR